MFNVVYDPFLTKRTTNSEKNSFMTPFFTLFVLSRASDNTTSQNIGGRMHGPYPHLKFLGDRPPSPPRSPPLGIYQIVDSNMTTIYLHLLFIHFIIYLFKIMKQI